MDACTLLGCVNASVGEQPGDFFFPINGDLQRVKIVESPAEVIPLV